MLCDICCEMHQEEKRKAVYKMGQVGGSDSKESGCSAEDPDLIPGSGRSPGEGNGYPLQYSCLVNPIDRVTKSWTRLMTNTFTSIQSHSHQNSVVLA